MNLFSKGELECIKPELPDADIVYCPNFLSEKEASAYFDIFNKTIDWEQDDIKIFGKVYPQPRLTALYGSEGRTYTYSGITMFPKPFTSELIVLKNKVEAISKADFNTVLLNLYRDGNDSNGWHSDDEEELGQHPFIASVSVGISRIFHFRHKQDKHLKYKLVLEPGSLLLMRGSTQHYWQHQLPKSKKITEARINLTFRTIK